MAGDPEFDAMLDQVLIGGREQRPVVIVDYDPSWPERFVEHGKRITAALGIPSEAVHHVGSTSVPDLGAKPIVDIIVEVPDPANEASYVPQLEGAGYELRVREADHWILRTVAHDVHVHCGSSPKRFVATCCSVTGCVSRRRIARHTKR